MKLRTKLIPIFTAASTAAVIAPITLTSCGEWIRYTDLLHRQYESWVIPHNAATITDARTVERLYIDKAIKNTDIVRDDILWSLSSLLHDETTSGKISSWIDYSSFDFDITIWPEQFYEGGILYTDYCSEIEAHVKGEIKQTSSTALIKYLVDKNGTAINSFDFNFNFKIFKLFDIEYVKDKQKIAFGDCKNVINLSFTDSFAELTTSGSYTIGTNTVEVPAEVEMFNPESYNPSISLHYGWLGASVLGLPQYAADFALDNEADFVFVSHYLKNITVNISD